MRLALLLLAVLASGCAPRLAPTRSATPVSVPGVPASSAEASAVLNGTVTSAALLPAGAIVTIRLEDVSRADAPADVLAEQTIRPTTGFPVPFSLAYRPGAVDVRHRYGVRVQIRDAAGALLFTTMAFTPVFTNGAPVDGVEAAVEPASR